MKLALALVLFVVATAAHAARERVLKQIDLPHDYYYRELYLPQVTSGPQYPAWSPDGAELVYAMAGSLWRQHPGSNETFELTHADGYDSQPDWSRDGRAIVFTRYRDDAVELVALDPATRAERALTRNRAVNLQPRVSPDGKRVAWVSTKDSGHFELFVADFDGAHLAHERRIVGGRESAIPRYYYSRFDHAIDPAWTPDGKRLVFVSNREVAYGTGDLWSVAVDEPSDIRKLWSEETAWRAAPDVAPDGRRIVYASFHGRPWHQLWLTTTAGEAPQPLTFGEFDRAQPRFSPDGRRVAFTSNEGGDLALEVLELAGGARTRIEPAARKYLRPTSTLTLETPMPARFSVTGPDGRAYAPATSWWHADDGFDRGLQRFENHYFHCARRCTLDVPVGKVTITASHGFGYRVARFQRDVRADGRVERIDLAEDPLPKAYGQFASADLHVHLNYGGHYRASAATLAAQARAEALDAAYELVVNKEQRVPDVALFDPAPQVRDGVLLVTSQEFHTSYWGHLGLLGLDDHLLLPGYSAYRASALSNPWPHNGVIADLAHAQHALVGYVHPFDAEIVPEAEKSLTNELPADVAHGKVDYYEVVGFADPIASAHVWHRLLNLGFRLPAGAGTDAMTNYASLRGPVGANRVFLQTPGTPPAAADLLDALRAGRTFATNGPLLGLLVEGQGPGADLARPAGRTKLEWRASVRSIVPLDHAELVYNGRAVAKLALKGDRTRVDASGAVDVDASGWLALRAWSDAAHPYVQDVYPYATTSPVYVTLGGARPRSREDAAYFVRWLDRVIADAGARGDYDDDRARRETLEYLESARAIYARLAGDAP